jgi:hypothetical protein
MKYTSATHPESTFQLLGRSWSLYCHTFWKVFFLSLVLSTIAFIPRIIALLAGRDVMAELPWLSPHQLWVFLIYIIDLTIFVAILWRLQCVTTDAHESLNQDIRVAVRKVPLILVAALTQFLMFLVVSLTAIGINYYSAQHHTIENANILGIFLLGLPAVFQMIFSIYIFYLFYFYLPIILTENQGAFAALSRSAKLVWGKWWKAFWPITLPWIAYFCVLIAFVKFGFSMHIYFFKVNNLTPAGTLLHILTFAVFIPWFAATALVVLRDLELRQKPQKKPRNRIKKDVLTSI